MKLNMLSPEYGSKKPRKRVGRGIGSGLGKTCGFGHKGQKSRAGGFKVGFEGGQMPLQRRLPKMGFTSRTQIYTDEIRLCELAKLNEEVIDMETLRKYRLVNSAIKKVKIILSGEINKAFTVKGIAVTKGARIAIEQLGGSVEE